MTAQPGGKAEHTNKLADELSPYLQQHAHNPVDWYPWSDEALKRAKDEDKPIFLSIGYASCHWCHVMERESFVDGDIARILNENFVNIKVDREQRPDLDQIYMSFTTALTGQGGWPMSVFLTPDLKPFFAGTYFPPEDNFGRPGFRKVITEISKAYEEQKEQILESSDDIFRQVNARLSQTLPDAVLNQQMVINSARSMMQNFDNTYGGLGQAPKFPHPVELSLFLRVFKRSGELDYRNAAEQSLSAMARGGIFDQVGGGFARYSTDARWLVPHFEKMLYDNSLLVPVYVEAFQMTNNELYRTIAVRTLDFMLREMRDNKGGFYSALDADSEGKEGEFYVWKKAEIEQVLGAAAQPFMDYFNVTDAGNFEGKNILHITPESDRVRADAEMADFDQYLETSLKALLKAREKRQRPQTDDKVVTSWNGLALSAFCRGYQVTRDERYLKAAIDNAEFVSNELFKDGRLIHSWRHGKTSAGEFLEDYAYYTRGVIDLYQTDASDNNQRWLTMATRLAERAIELFLDDTGNFYLRPDGEADLIMRPKEDTDGALPAPGSIMMASLFKLHRLTGRDVFNDAASKAIRAVSGLLERLPGGMTSAALALDYYVSNKLEIVVVGNGEVREEMLAEIHSRYLPNGVVAIGTGESDDSPLFEGRDAEDGKATVYVCINSACRLPVTTPEALQEQLDGL